MMAFEVVVPQMGESVLEGTIVEWKVKVGDKVIVNQPLVEIMTDKVNVEIPSEVAGIITSLNVEPGEVVPVGKLLCVIDAEGAVSTETSHEHAEMEQKVARTAPDVPAKAAAPKPSGAARKTKPGEKPKMAPAVRKLVRDYGLDATTIAGSGPDGRITRDDVEAAAAARSSVAGGPPPKPVTQPAAPAPTAAAPKAAPLPPAPEGAVEERMPLEGPRKLISDHMIRSRQTSAHVTTFEDCDFTNLVEYRKVNKEWFAETYGAKLTYMPFIVKAATEALKEFPKLNASMTDTEIVLKKFYNVGIAVAKESGLIVPVIKSADRKSIIELAIEINDLGLRARDEKLTLDDVQGGTFTVTNAGMFGATASTPIINQPQVAILGIHNISEKPVVRNGEIVIRHMSTFGLSFDHRLIDGHTAVQFLHMLIGFLEDPTSLVMRLR
jgi:2-oxoglutarate dehydrogenase complex dihydrolipoamide succinyltransferase (E2) component